MAFIVMLLAILGVLFLYAGIQGVPIGKLFNE